MNHTPGPWHDEEISLEMCQIGPYAVIRDSKDNVIAYLPKGANVVLIAAAPEMLSALHLVGDYLCKGGQDPTQALPWITSAIAKATAAPAAKDNDNG